MKQQRWRTHALVTSHLQSWGCHLGRSACSRETKPPKQKFGPSVPPSSPHQDAPSAHSVSPVPMRRPGTAPFPFSLSVAVQVGISGWPAANKRKYRAGCRSVAQGVGTTHDFNRRCQLPVSTTLRKVMVRTESFGLTAEWRATLNQRQSCGFRRRNRRQGRSPWWSQRLA